MTPYCTKEGVANASRCVMGASQNESELVRLCLILHILPTMCSIFSLFSSNLYCNGNIVLDRHFHNERGSFKNPGFLYSWIKQKGKLTYYDFFWLCLFELLKLWFKTSCFWNHLYTANVRLYLKKKGLLLFLKLENWLIDYFLLLYSRSKSRYRLIQ